MMRTDEASEIAGVSPSANTSIMPSEFGVVVDPMSASTLLSPMSLRVFWTAVVVSDASSSTMYSIDLPPAVFGHIGIVLRSGMPSDAAGPVADTVTPIRTCAAAVAVASTSAPKSAQRTNERPIVILLVMFARPDSRPPRAPVAAHRG
jgi:hypothetical protein